MDGVLADYDSDIVFDKLCSNNPSIVGARRPNGNGHIFIADRYRRSSFVYRFFYRFYPDDPSYSPSMFPEVMHIVYVPLVRYLGFNWGFNGQGDNIWVVDDGDWYYYNYLYNYDRQMITFCSDEEDPDEPED